MSDSKLTTVYFPKDEDPGYRKAIVNVTEVEFFLELGAKRTVPEMKMKPVEPKGGQSETDPKANANKS